jgi:hypothetical protein
MRLHFWKSWLVNQDLLQVCEGPLGPVLLLPSNQMSNRTISSGYWHHFSFRFSEGTNFCVVPPHISGCLGLSILRLHMTLSIGHYNTPVNHARHTRSEISFVNFSYLKNMPWCSYNVQVRVSWILISRFTSKLEQFCKNLLWKNALLAFKPQKEISSPAQTEVTTVNDNIHLLLTCLMMLSTDRIINEMQRMWEIMTIVAE